MTATDLTPQPTHTGTDDDLNHVYCCNENRGLCGTDLTHHAESDDETTCVVCAELTEANIPCGPGCSGVAPGAGS